MILIRLFEYRVNDMKSEASRICNTYIKQFEQFNMMKNQIIESNQKKIYKKRRLCDYKNNNGYHNSPKKGIT